jgi:predicted nucleic acid-binding protein
VSRYVLDTQLYFEAARDPEKAEALAKFSAAFLPSLLLHAIVVQEILAGAVSKRWRREIERGLVGPFERRGRVVVPGYRAWKRSGEVVADLVARKKISPGGLRRSFMNDVLLAASCRESGLILITRNAGDFELIAKEEPLRFTKPWPTARGAAPPR